MSKLPAMQPHTAAKHLLLRRYLDRWFPILGKYSRRINYIDGFAGPGAYESGEKGSPMLAIESALAHIKKGTLANDIQINFVFIESNSKSAEQLQESLPLIDVPDTFHVEVRNGAFAIEISHILDGLDAAGTSIAPTFFFVDPFGFSGIPFELLSRILAYEKCEVFVNVMVEHINRFLEHPDSDVVAHIPLTFGTDEVFEIAKWPEGRVAGSLDLYKRQLGSKARFVGQFNMKGQRDQNTYSLFFATNHVLGFQKMKEAMWSVDKVEGASFSDADPNQQFAFDLFGCEPLWDDLLDQFCGNRVPMAQVDQFVIQKTDYLPKHARAVLKKHESSGDISVDVVPGCRRRRGQFPKDKVFIRFK